MMPEEGGERRKEPMKTAKPVVRVSEIPYISLAQGGGAQSANGCQSSSGHSGGR
jgi:hypothetical protein